jgi:hypothetical protein
VLRRDRRRRRRDRTGRRRLPRRGPRGAPQDVEGGVRRGDRRRGRRDGGPGDRRDAAAAAAARAAALDRARAGDWHSDVALAHELAARCHVDPAAARRALMAARDAYAAWGAAAKVAQIDARLG